MELHSEGTKSIKHWLLYARQIYSQEVSSIKYINIKWTFIRHLLSVWLFFQAKRAKLWVRRKKYYFNYYLFVFYVKPVKKLSQICWQFLSMTPNGATQLRKGYHVKNVPFPHMSSEHSGSLNTARAHTLLGAEKRPYQVQFPREFGSLNLKGYTERHTWVMHNRSLPLSITTVYFSSLLPGVLDGDLTFTLQLSHK